MASFKQLYTDAKLQVKLQVAKSIHDPKLVVAYVNSKLLEIFMLEGFKFESLPYDDSSFYKFKLNDIIMIGDGVGCEFSLQAMIDYDIEHHTNKYDQIIAFLKQKRLDQKEFYTTDEVIECFNKNDLTLYVNSKLKNAAKPASSSMF